ncbi:hypothetical protein PR202_ga26501 [Eleusine coracana subsp. coracana]|uniref:RST domain-containing protein n=1 Tax=Eleusine coracana subsp. coracana TaxID=191504 RepID=A0AAV5DC20_ELECO|nr:hypothetical protein PR202_ga26501 [Eleusine coracana subsp. coracana]
MELSSCAAVKKAATTMPAVAAGVGNAEASMLMRRWREFTTCGEPARFLCFDQEDGRWADVEDHEAAEELRAAFRDRRVLAEVAVGGRAFLFDFLRMARIDVDTAEQAPLGWIDGRGACYFPAPDVGSTRKRRRDDADAESSSGVEERWSGESRGTSGSGSGSAGEKAKKMKKQPARWDSAAALEEGDRDYQLISKLFLTRGMASRGAEVTAVRRVARGTQRVAAFQRQGQLVAAKRGEAAAVARFAWYGAPAEDVAAAVEQGVTKSNAGLIGAARAHGDGVHLAPPQCPYTRRDRRGTHRAVPCDDGPPGGHPSRVLQSQPSSDAYDSAVDGIANPHWYVVWSKDMNTRILPEFVVSFKCPNLHAKESSEATSKLKKPASPSRDMFPTLLAELEKFVPYHKCQTLQETYDCFKNGQIRKDQFTRFLRNYVGDKVLTTVAKKLRGY